MKMDSKRSEDLARIDREHLWHPYTQMQEYPGPTGPLIVERGQGSYVIDVDGRRYLDGYAQMWCNVFGHGDRRLANALHQQALKISHSSLFSASNVPSIELTEQMVELTREHFAPNGLPHVFFSDNGSTAVEVALKAAVQFQRNVGETQRTQLLCFSDAYHGDTAATMTLGGVDLFRREYEPLTFQVVRSTYPMQARPDRDAHPDEVAKKSAAIRELEELFGAKGNSIAAAIIEPGCQGAGGVRPCSPGFLPRLRELCDEHGVLLVADEVLTGFGRGGGYFASARETVTPDLIALGKALTAGYIPLSLTLATTRVYEAFLGTRSDFKHLFHGHTYTGNQLGGAVALETLKMIKDKKLMQRVIQANALMSGRMDTLESHPNVGRTRLYGVMGGVPVNSESGAGTGYEANFGQVVCAEALKRDVIIRPLGDVIVIMPVLNMSDDDLNRLFDVLEESIESALRMA